MAQRASHGYEELKNTVRGDFVPFDEALKLLLGLAKELDIPDSYL